MTSYPIPEALDPQITGPTTSPFPETTAQPHQSDVDEFLRKKRKAREHKACYPCRQRKVKCDLSRPCQTCRDRDHPELCSYHPPNKRQNLDLDHPLIKAEENASAGGGFVTLARGEFDMLCSKLNGLEHSIAELRDEISRNAVDPQITGEGGHVVRDEAPPKFNGRDHGQERPLTHTDVHGIHTRNEAGEIVHFGGGSIPAMLYALGQGQGESPDEKQKLQELLGRSVLPLFGLDNESATYPFVDLWGLPHGSLQRAQELAKALPNDQQCLQLMRSYRDLGHVIYPGVANLPALEIELDEFLVARAALADTPDGFKEQSVYGKSYPWLSVLFAVLGSGAQCSAMSRKERELTSQPHLESIQALATIGNVMMNNMNAGTAWSLLGLTIRLAQGLGLHRSCPPQVSKEDVLPRSKTWWAIIWQDSLLSITYDRASTTSAMGVVTMPMPQHYEVIGSYHATMYRLSKINLEIVHDRATTLTEDVHRRRILEHRDAISALMRDSADYLRDSRNCTTSKETLEHWGLYLHTSYALSELYRPAISPNRSTSELARLFRRPCVEHLTNTLDAYLGLNNITSFAKQSWAAVHRALSSALLLGILGEHLRNERARRLISRFMVVMSDLTDAMDPQEISAPVQRGLAALGKLRIHDRSDNYTGNSAALTGVGDAASVTSEGSNRIDHAADLVTPSMDGQSVLGEDHSPYAVLNSILWGSAADSYTDAAGM
ncbi:hypothetical protein LTR62_002435 [Meristemomyces frigidus]|uniref:Zn(2)-C6 fungal-type domain-containing protein n=1 Tax=Meristemomyces frigidus TaxID=1508187 RepID=A0AAN7TFQ9_9PEZI|nr:hypothetical protein LTR62_002435 [Meristemomyces frigidus]